MKDLDCMDCRRVVENVPDDAARVRCSQCVSRRLGQVFFPRPLVRTTEQVRAQSLAERKPVAPVRPPDNRCFVNGRFSWEL